MCLGTGELGCFQLDHVLCKSANSLVPGCADAKTKPLAEKSSSNDYRPHQH